MSGNFRTSCILAGRQVKFLAVALRGDQNVDGVFDRTEELEIEFFVVGFGQDSSPRFFRTI